MCGQNGVRGLMLDLYDFRDDIWVCHSFKGKCYDFTAFVSYLSLLTSLFDRWVGTYGDRLENSGTLINSTLFENSNQQQMLWVKYEFS